jgi:CrcB protein
MFFMLGVFGGFTTFSSFSLQTLNLIQDGEWLYVSGYVIGSLVLCLVGVWLGHMLGMAYNR